MNVTVGQVADAFEALQSIANQNVGGRAALEALRFTRWARPVFARYSAQRQAVAARVGEKITDERSRVPPAKLEEFAAELAPLRAEAVEVPPGLQISAQGLLGADAKISLQAIAALEPFLKGLDALDALDATTPQ